MAELLSMSDRDLSRAAARVTLRSSSSASSTTSKLKSIFLISYITISEP